jgi:hypothetical protein
MISMFYAERYSRKSLRILGSAGEPINTEAWMWYNEVVGNGRCPVVDTYWQTETGAPVITPLPGITKLKPGSAVRAHQDIFNTIKRYQRREKPTFLLLFSTVDIALLRRGSSHHGRRGTEDRRTRRRLPGT